MTSTVLSPNDGRSLSNTTAGTMTQTLSGNNNDNSNNEVTNTTTSITRESSILNNTEPKRVKVYILENNEWKDTGTGFCIGEIVTETTSDAKGKTNSEIHSSAYLIVNNEESPSNLLLKSKLEGNIEYQRQEETLIVWKDAGGHDIALSFEESIGCDSLCEFIVHVQRTIENNISLVAVRSSDSGIGSIHEIIAGPVTLPAIDKQQDTNSLMASLKLLNENTTYEFLKNETIEFILQSNYIDILIDYFKIAEEDHSLKDLLLLSSIIKSLILYNNRDILELMVDDEHIMGIIGILEYDTEFPTMKANHREYLKSGGPSFKEVFPLENNDLKIIVKKSFRLQFLKDVVLVRFLDDNNFNLILDIILDLETCIMDFLQKDPFLDQIMNLYDLINFKNDKDIPEIELQQKRKDGIKLLHQCVQMSKTLDPIDKTRFYKSLLKKGLFNVLKYAFDIETDSHIRILATDTIITIIEHDIMLIQTVQREKLNSEIDGPILDSSSSTNNKLTNQKETEDMKLLSILSMILLSDKSPGLREQVVQALNTLLHPDGCLNNGESEFDSNGGNNLLNKFNFNMDSEMDTDFVSSIDLRSDITNPDLTDFQLKRYFSNFYEQIAPILFSPLIDGNHELDDYLLIHLVKLVSFIATEHNRVMSRTFIMEKGILKAMSHLLEEDHVLQLRLTALRTIKNIMLLNDKYYHRYMISENIFDPLFVLMKENATNDNLTSSSIRDFCRIISTNSSPYENGLNYSNNNNSNNNSNNNALLQKSNFTILHKYLIERFGELLKQYYYVPFIKEFLKLNDPIMAINKTDIDEDNEKKCENGEDSLQDISMDDSINDEIED